MSARAPAGVAAQPRRRSKVVGTMAGVKVKGDTAALGRRAGVLLASEGRTFTPESIALAIELARPTGRGVVVMSCARLHGVAFGLPNPGLLPTKAEWAAQEEHVATAVARIKRKGVPAEGQVLGTRNPAKRICALAQELGAHAIVMGADPPKPRLLGGMMWSQEPQAVQRRAGLPVHLTV